MIHSTNILYVLVALLVSTTLVAYTASERPPHKPAGEIIIDPAPSPAVLDCLWKVENMHYDNDHEKFLSEMNCYRNS